MAAVDPANQFGDFDSLNGVTALSPHDVWAVGQYDVFATGAYDQTLAEHWDRASWTVVPTPQPLEQTSVLNAVAAVGPKDMWAVGYGRDIGTS